LTKCVLIAGSRNPKNIFQAKLLVDEMVQRLEPGMVVLNGGAKGIDTYVLDAMNHFHPGGIIDLGTGWGFEKRTPWPDEVIALVFRANWKRDGKAAGIIRNLHMLDLKPDMVVVVWNGESPGSRHVAEEAKRRGIHTEVMIA
jgi:hypothetical protein